MDYGRFVARYGPGWDQAEALLSRHGALDHAELERLAATHRRVVSEFGYVRTHFPGTDAERRLRRLAIAGHQALAVPEAPWWPRLVAFLTRGWRRRFQADLRYVAVAAALFVGGVLLGFVLTGIEPDTAAVFIGVDGVEQIRSGDIWTDHLSQMLPPGVLSSSIATNNISVGLMAWAGGAILGLGTAYILVFNGLMFGSVVALCWQYGMLDRLLAFISTHGPLELTLIVVAGGAGLCMARGQLAVDEGPRAEVFGGYARRSLGLALGTVPWFVLLGLVEGYLSPVMAIPTSAKAALGLALLAVFAAYALAPVAAAEEGT